MRTSKACDARPALVSARQRSSAHALQTTYLVVLPVPPEREGASIAQKTAQSGLPLFNQKPRVLRDDEVAMASAAEAY